MTEQIIIFFQIIFIDLVLAGDNAIIIGMVASQFKDEIRKKIIFWGIGAAIILRIIFTLITAYLLQINGLKTIGGLLLLYISYKLYKDVIKNEIYGENKIEAKNLNFFKSIVTVAIADISMSLDNVLGVAGAAIVLRIVFTLITAYLLQINGLKTIGGLLLFYIAYKLYKDVIKNEINDDKKIETDSSTFFKAIMTVVIADVSMSLDNVLGVAGAARDHYVLLVFGLILSILLMATVATIISKWIKKYKWIGWLGLLAILAVAIQLIYSDLKIFI